MVFMAMPVLLPWRLWRKVEQAFRWLADWLRASRGQVQANWETSRIQGLLARSAQACFDWIATLYRPRRYSAGRH